MFRKNPGRALNYANKTLLNLGDLRKTLLKRKK